MRGAPPSSWRRLRPPRPRVGKGPTGTSKKRGNNGGRGHHFGSFPPDLPAPHQDLLSERVENNGTGRPPTRRRPRRRPGTRYQGPARRGEPREEQMAADGAQGQAYLSTASVYGGSNRDGGGKPPSLPVPGLPPSRPPGRMREVREAGLSLRALRGWLCRMPS